MKIAGFGIFLISVCISTPGFSDDADKSQLKDCPNKPNCVSSQLDKSDDRHVAALKITDSALQTLSAIEKIILSEARTNIVLKNDHYLHATYTSLIFRFTDDIEFLIAEDGQSIDVRSASRVGHSDFGINRKRVDAIRQKLSQ